MVPGVEFAGVGAGIKPSGLDLGIALFKEEMNVLTLYTKNRVKAAHILYDRKIDGNPVRALVVNSGCANACTGNAGMSDIRTIVGGLASHLRIPEKKILFASTGVIGKRLSIQKILHVIPQLARNLKESHIDAFAQAIMTTDTYPKIIQETFRGKKTYRIVGVAKGSGMINPLFATMLAFVFTDYPVSRATIQRTFVSAVSESFERITVDGECSTNDTVMLFTKRGGEDVSALGAFKETLFSVMKELAVMIVRDGEGATRVIHITVKGAKKREIAEKIARRISVSPLTKTAFFGCDPNWGRIIAAAGDAGVAIEPSKAEIIMQGEVLAREGVEVPFNEEAVKKLMGKKEVELVVDLHDGKASFDIYTTDFTYDYVRINASYRS